MKIVNIKIKIVRLNPRCSKRARIEKSFGLDFLTYMLEGEPQTYRGSEVEYHVEIGH